MKALKEEGIFLDAVGMLKRSVQGKFATIRSSKKVLGGSALELIEDLGVFRCAKWNQLGYDLQQ